MAWSIADLKDSLRAVYWTARRAIIWPVWRNDLRYCMADPESPQAMFNVVILGVARSIPSDPPAEVILTPGNILAYAGPISGNRPVSRSRNDSAEVWRRMRKHLHRNLGRIDLTTGGYGRPFQLAVTVTLRNDERILIQVREGPAIPSVEEIQKRYGMIQPVQPFVAIPDESAD
ncbi:MAG: hypothetical protein GXY44_04730 [Phycisphaerales bacterium]|nr:hypothetical protein [Phycisphaerales bacterium]